MHEENYEWEPLKTNNNKKKTFQKLQNMEQLHFTLSELHLCKTIDAYTDCNNNSLHACIFFYIFSRAHRDTDMHRHIHTAVI